MSDDIYDTEASYNTNNNPQINSMKLNMSEIIMTNIGLIDGDKKINASLHFF